VPRSPVLQVFRPVGWVVSPTLKNTSVDGLVDDLDQITVAFLNCFSDGASVRGVCFNVNLVTEG
jgi:hypothetical protein